MNNINLVAVITLLLLAATLGSCVRGNKVDQAQSQSHPQVQGQTVPKVYSISEALADAVLNKNEAAIRVLEIRDSKQGRTWVINCAHGAVGGGAGYKQQPPDDVAIDICTHMRDLHCTHEHRNEPQCRKEPSWEVRHFIKAKCGDGSDLTRQPSDDEALNYCTWLRDLYCTQEGRNEPQCSKQPN